MRGRAIGKNPPRAPATAVAQRQVHPQRGLSTCKTLSNSQTHTEPFPLASSTAPRVLLHQHLHADARLLPQVEKLLLLLHPTVCKAKTIHTAARLQLLWLPPVLHRLILNVSPSLQHQLFLSSLEQQLVASLASGIWTLYSPTLLFSGSLCCTCRPFTFSHL